MALEAVDQPVVLRTDQLVAEEIRSELGPLLDQVCKVYDKARAAGLHCGFNIAPDTFGKKHRVVEISVFKPL